MDRIVVSEQLKQYMREKNLTQAQFASELGIRQPQLSRWLAGKDTPRKAWTELLKIKGILKEEIKEEKV